ncbi:LysR family transcriptional regulator [Kribbella sp. NPDC006257]|uniref:LysR family transcriptional regulator n=1 Tax=Kribbella sp. NPDC006257 TaxID=3156738 RepID=UPI0033A72CC6
MELRQIQYFVAVAEVLNFGRAADQLQVGQPAVSQQVARLERELGVQLFDRSARAIRLTEAGQRFLPEARTVLTSVERARDAAVAPAGQTLRLGTSTGLGERLDAVLVALGEKSIEVELFSASTRTRLDRVRAGQLDAAFVRGLDTASGLDLIPVWQDQLLAALPAAASHLTFPDLAGLPLRIVSRRDNPALVDLVMNACADAGFEPLLGPRSQNLQDTLASIGSGTPGWTVVYQSHANLLRHPRVVFKPLGLQMTTLLAVPEGATISGALAVLLTASHQFE